MKHFCRPSLLVCVVATGCAATGCAATGCAAASCAGPAQQAPPASADRRHVDLTHDLSAESIFWPTGETFRLDKVADGMTDKGYYYASNNYSGSEHGGTALDQLPPRGAIVYALPMKIKGGSGSPLRAIASIPAR